MSKYSKLISKSVKFRINTIAVFFLITIISCSKKDSSPPTPPPPNPAITVSKTNLAVGSVKGFLDSFVVQSNVAWKLKLVPADAASWLSVGITAGVAGNTKVIVNVLGSNPNASQTCSISIIPNDGSTSLANVEINQKAYLINWNKLFGGSSTERANSAVKTSSGGIAIAGLTYSNDGDVTNNHGQTDLWVINLDASGNLIWQKAIGGSDYDVDAVITTTTDGGFFVGGTSSSNDGDLTGNHGGSDYVAVKLDASGNIVWQKAFGGSGNDFLKAMAPTSDGGVVVTGYTLSNDGDVIGYHGNGDFFTLKLDANGEIVWKKTMGSSNSDQAFAIAATADGGFVVGGSTNGMNDGDVVGDHTGVDTWMVKLDANGNMIWQKAYGTINGEEIRSISTDANDELLVAAASTDYGGNTDVWFLKCNSNGEMIWQQTLGGSGEEVPKSIMPTDDGGVLMSAFSHSNDGDVTSNHGARDQWVVKLDGMGNKVWERSFGGAADDETAAALPTADGGFYLAGYSYGGGGDLVGVPKQGDIWVLKLK